MNTKFGILGVSNYINSRNFDNWDKKNCFIHNVEIEYWNLNLGITFSGYTLKF